jgi:hypothetical protein
VGYKFVGFDEAAFIEQQIHAFARRELACLALSFTAFSTAALFGDGVACSEFSELSPVW